MFGVKILYENYQQKFMILGIFKFEEKGLDYHFSRKKGVLATLSIHHYEHLSVFGF